MTAHLVRRDDQARARPTDFTSAGRLRVHLIDLEASDAYPSGHSHSVASNSSEVSGSSKLSSPFPPSAPKRHPSPGELWGLDARPTIRQLPTTRRRPPGGTRQGVTSESGCRASSRCGPGLHVLPRLEPAPESASSHCNYKRKGGVEPSTSRPSVPEAGRRVDLYGYPDAELISDADFSRTSPGHPNGDNTRTMVELAGTAGARPSIGMVPYVWHAQDHGVPERRGSRGASTTCGSDGPLAS